MILSALFFTAVALVPSAAALVSLQQPPGNVLPYACTDTDCPAVPAKLIRAFLPGTPLEKATLSPAGSGDPKSAVKSAAPYKRTRSDPVPEPAGSNVIVY